jgi:hydrogenase small subunit
MKITRRQFLQYCTASAAALGLSQMDLLKLEKALAADVCGCEDYGVPHVIWMQGQSCGGCTLSILNRMMTKYPPELLSGASFSWTPSPLDGTTSPSTDGLVQDIVDLLVGDAVGALTTPSPGTWAPFPNGYINLDYQSEVMAAAGDLITDHVECLEDNTPFFLALSGAIPMLDYYYYQKSGSFTGDVRNYQPFSVAGSFDTGDGHGKIERSIAEVVEWLGTSPNCLGVVAFGTCASYGGIPAAYGNWTAAAGAYEFLVNYAGHSELAGKIINCPGCAPHPDWMILPVAYYILTSQIIDLDTTAIAKPVYIKNSKVLNDDVALNRARAIYTGDKGYTIFCQACPRYSETDLCTDLGAGPGNGDGTSQKEFCTRPSGCNGPYASPDCPTRRWNNFDDHQPNQWCVGSGLGSATPNHTGPNYVCQGCAEIDFPDGRSPFFSAAKNGS